MFMKMSLSKSSCTPEVLGGKKKTKQNSKLGPQGIAVQLYRKGQFGQKHFPVVDHN